MESNCGIDRRPLFFVIYEYSLVLVLLHRAFYVIRRIDRLRFIQLGVM